MHLEGTLKGTSLCTPRAYMRSGPAAPSPPEQVDAALSLAANQPGYLSAGRRSTCYFGIEINAQADGQKPSFLPAKENSLARAVLFVSLDAACPPLWLG